MADTLLGRTPFTDRLPDTWAEAIDTATGPIDVGSPNTTALPARLGSEAISG